jgi:hypothetical protein
VQSAQQEQILITQNNRAIALLMGLENFDPEQWHLQLSPEFGQMISDRRKRSTIPLSLVEAELENLGDD